MFGSLGGSGCFLRISFLPKNLSAIAGLRGGRHVLCQRAEKQENTGLWNASGHTWNSEQIFSMSLLPIYFCCAYRQQHRHCGEDWQQEMGSCENEDPLRLQILVLCINQNWDTSFWPKVPVILSQRQFPQPRYTQPGGMLPKHQKMVWGFGVNETHCEASNLVEKGYVKPSYHDLSIYIYRLSSYIYLQYPSRSRKILRMASMARVSSCSSSGRPWPLCHCMGPGNWAIETGASILSSLWLLKGRTWLSKL